MLLLALFCVSGVYAARKEKTVKKEVDFISGGAVSVKTVNGSIDVQSWNRKSVSVVADIRVKAKSMQRAEEMMSRVKINVDKNGDRLYITADYPKRHNGLLDWVFGKSVSVSVSFDVNVPEKCDLRLRTTNGSIEAEDIVGDTQIESTNGAVQCSGLRGSVYGHTVNGGLRIHAVPENDSDEVELETVNGAIKLVLPADVRAYVDASTVNGGISSDFDIKVTGKFNNKRARGRINGGGSDIQISTVNGGISIRKDR